MKLERGLDLFRDVYALLNLIGVTTYKFDDRVMFYANALLSLAPSRICALFLFLSAVFFRR